MAKFLLEAKVLQSKGTAVGITNSVHATLSDGTLTHDAHIQTIDESKTSFQTAAGTEINFRDTWKFNVAAYKLDRLLHLNMTPVSVERRSSSYTWWIDNAMMEIDRVKKKLSAPDSARWNNEMHVVRIFDQLIFNTDRNLQNLLIDKNWNIWMIDHTRAFRMATELKEPKNVERIDRQLLEDIKRLDQKTLTATLAPYVSAIEIKGILGRRDRIVKLIDDKVKRDGADKIIYERAAR